MVEYTKKGMLQRQAMSPQYLADEEVLVKLTRHQWYWVLEAMRAKVQMARGVNDRYRLRELQLIERIIEGAAQ